VISSILDVCGFGRGRVFSWRIIVHKTYERRNAIRRPKLEVLDQEDVQKIIEAAYDLLENFGVKIDNQEALEILADREQELISKRG